MTALRLRFGFSVGNNFTIYQFDRPIKQQMQIDVAVVAMAVLYSAQHPARFQPVRLNQSRYPHLIFHPFSFLWALAIHPISFNGIQISCPLRDAMRLISF